MAYEIPILDIGLKATTTILQYRVVKASSGSGGLVHTTGTSGKKALGVAQTSASTTKPICSVRVYGVTKVVCSTKAVPFGSWLRATSGAVSTGSALGGTVRATTSYNTQHAIGIALTSAAAGAGKRVISMLLLHAGRLTTAAA